MFPNDPRAARSKLRFRPLETAAWTHHKATFIRDYLKLFVAITQHGTYIDGFAGPQRLNQLDSWSAKLVLESRPKRLREFHLCEMNPTSFKAVAQLASSQSPIDERGRPNGRMIDTYEADFNTEIGTILSRCNKERTATFCLLDQRTFECHWDTVRRIAEFKRPGYPKVEMFYFLAVGWSHRSFSGISTDKAAKWWGRNDWEQLRKFSCEHVRDLFVERFKSELGYIHVNPFPIYERDSAGHVLYYMIHASDHDEAPKLMARAYRSAVRGKSTITQSSFNLRSGRLTF